MASKTCVECSEGKYKGAGQGACLPCAAEILGTFTVGKGSTSRNDCKCDRGYYGDTADDSGLLLVPITDQGVHIGDIRMCGTCPVGKYKDFVGAKATGGDIEAYTVDCTECEVGKAAATRCFDGFPDPALAGMDGSRDDHGTGNGGCSALDPDTQVIKFECADIITKQDCKTDDQKKKCCACGGGVKDYTPVAQATCSACSPGKYTSTPCSAACSNMFTTKDGNEVDTCQTGNIADFKLDCKKCLAGSYSDRTRAATNKCCDFGHAANTDQCSLCEAGKHQNASGASACLQCPHTHQTSPVGKNCRQVLRSVSARQIRHELHIL